jgi:hypothetical protein
MRELPIPAGKRVTASAASRRQSVRHDRIVQSLIVTTPPPKEICGTFVSPALPKRHDKLDDSGADQNKKESGLL